MNPLISISDILVVQAGLEKKERGRGVREGKLEKAPICPSELPRLPDQLRPQ
jgi:hypothetical protein